LTKPLLLKLKVNPDLQ